MNENVSHSLIKVANQMFFQHLITRPSNVLPVSAAATLALFSSFSVAQEADKSLVAFDPIVVTATRTEKPLSETASSLAVVSDKEIETRGYQSISEALLEIPNVTITSPENPLFSRVSIRGSDENQITYVIDGVRQDNYTLSGNRPTGIFMDPELVKQIEVKHGGGSALYGNGGIGGTLAVTTKLAEDFLEDGETFGTKVKTGYSTTNQEWMSSAYAFGRWNALDVLMAVTRRNSGDEKLSDGERSNNSTDTKYTSLLLKTSLVAGEDALFSLAYTYDDYDSSWLYEGADPMDYAYEQHRITASAEYTSGNLFDIRAHVQYTKQNFSMDQILGNLGGMGQGNSDSLEAWAANVQNTSRLEFLGAHTLTYGADISHTEQDALTYNPYHPTPFPDASRPDSKSLDWGVFVQDEIAINDYISVIPMLRYSYFKRESSNPDYKDFSDSKVTPGITVSVTPMNGLSFWASAVEGFRAPVLDELYYSVDLGMPWLPGGVVDANPDLKPEKSWNYEVGMNALFGGLITDRDQTSIKAAFFYDDVEDFININSSIDNDGIEHFRAENIGRVVRKGVELTGTYAIDNFSATASYGLVHVTDKETDKRVTGITPQSVNLKLDYKLPKQFLNTWYRLSWNDAASGDKDKNTATTRVNYDSFVTHSLGLTWTPKIPNFWDFAAGVAIENITDEEYRYVNGSWGYGRGVRVWVSGRF